MDTASLSHCIEPARLAALIGRPDAPLLLDVRRTPVYRASDALLAGASHCAPDDVARLATSRPPQTVVVYCAFGHGVGRDAAATLRAAGWDARWLAGGIEGGEPGVDDPGDIRRWRAAALPRVAKPVGTGAAGDPGAA